MRIFSKSFMSCLILIALNLKSQNYIPMPLQNCYWMIYPSSGTMNPNTFQQCIYNDIYKIIPQGDTVISAKHYVKFYSFYVGGSGNNISAPCNPYTAPTTTVSYYFCVRQDTAARKLYMVDPNSAVEKLMFDFTQNAGDTVKAVSGAFGSVPPGGTTQYRVIDSVQYRLYSDGLCHKVYKLKPFANTVGLTANTEIIEGFGNETGLAIKVKSANNGSSSQAYGNAMLVVNTATLAATASTCQPLTVRENSKEEIGLFPNPVHDYFYIDAKNICSVELYSFTGQLLEAVVQKEGNKNMVDLKGSPAGYYYVKIVSGANTYSKKIIKAND